MKLKVYADSEEDLDKLSILADLLATLDEYSDSYPNITIYKIANSIDSDHPSKEFLTRLKFILGDVDAVDLIEAIGRYSQTFFDILLGQNVRVPFDPIFIQAGWGMPDEVQ